MGVQFQRRRNQIENLYHHLEDVRTNMRSLITNNLDNLTLDNLHILEMEEERILSRILKLKTMLNLS